MKYKNYDEVIEKQFKPMLRERPDILQQFLDSDDPADFAYRIAISENFDEVLKREREEGREEGRKSLLEEFNKKKIIPSLSSIGGSSTPSKPSEIQKEINELIS